MQPQLAIFSLALFFASVVTNASPVSSAFTRMASAPSQGDTGKITVAPSPTETAEADAATNSEDTPVTIKKAVIETEPAPGLKSPEESADDRTDSSTDPSVVNPGPTEKSETLLVTPSEKEKASTPTADEPTFKLRSVKKVETQTPPPTKRVKAVMKMAPQAAPKVAPEATASVSAETSLHWLANGNARYVGKHFRADGRQQVDRDRTLNAQHPHAIVLSCSDSRVPTETIFDQGIGEIFTVRVAGEALDTSVIASIEYAIEHFHPKLLVVLGHTRCGAVEAALTVKDEDSAGSASLDALLSDIRPRLKTVMTEKHSENLEVESTLNADGVARDLVKRSEIVRTAVSAGDLVIKSSLYHLDTGKVKFY